VKSRHERPVESELTFDAQPTSPRASAIDRAAARLIDGWLRRSGAADLAVTLWNGVGLGAAAPRFRVRLHDRTALVRVLLDPEFQLPECYAEGAIDVEGDLIAFFEALLGAGSGRPSWRTRAKYAADLTWRRIVPTPAQRNARHHYDLSNDFYSAWLDESMTYTCAYFSSADVKMVV
jgi:cyclopropane-fatty-acyl-phospholipid synthase